MSKFDADVAQSDVAEHAAPRNLLWQRQLAHYPANGKRAMYLGLVVLITVLLYYELYIQGAVATQIITHFHMSLTYYIVISVIGNAVGALASLAAGLADRWGRANLVVGGLLMTGLLILFGLPNAGSKLAYLVLFAIVSLVEGVILVATPALVRDFSPQLGRASAMGFWTLGPVVGSLVVTSVSSATLSSHPDWEFQFRLCGAIGLVVFVLALVALRELSPQLRDQLMVSLRDKVLIEARAAGIDPEKALRGSWRQMLKLDVVGPAFAISVFLLFYYILVGFFVIYFAVSFGYSEARANGLANWYWAFNAIALVGTGVLSDKLKVRKPFMIVGGLISAAGVAVFAVLSTRPDTSYHTFAGLLAIIAIGAGLSYTAWMAAFTETVERHNPAATATGLAVWGGIIRSVVTVSLIGLIFAIPSAGVLVDHGHHVATLAARYEPQLATLAALTPATRDALGVTPDDPAVQGTAVSELAKVPVPDVVAVSVGSKKYATELATLQSIAPATLAALGANPADPAAGAAAVGDIARTFGIDAAAATGRLVAAGQVPKADLALLQTSGPKVAAAAARLTAVGAVPKADLGYLKDHGTQVQQAQVDSPREWQRWWWICFAAQLLFLPFVFLMKGRWSPRKAAADNRAHRELVERELAAMRLAKAPVKV
jgi:ACS family D-galactonate transporter-like MFS transporter